MVLGGKDGLALISANGVSVGQAALVAGRPAQVAEAADVAAALSMEAIGANTSVLHPAVGQAKPIPGQVAAADSARLYGFVMELSPLLPAVRGVLGRGAMSPAVG